MCMQLHQRLRTARERMGLSLTIIARQHGVREQNLRLIEQNAFEDLPTGIYGRHAVRSYAAAVGLPQDEALAEVIDRLRTPEDPMEGIARVRGLSAAAARRAGVVHDVEPAEVTRPSQTWRQIAAAAIDGALLVAIDLVLLEMTARVAGVSATEVLRVGTPSMVVLCAVIAGVYFVLLGGIGRATIGTQLAHAPATIGTLEGVDVRTVMLRGLQFARFHLLNR